MREWTASVGAACLWLVCSVAVWQGAATARAGLPPAETGNASVYGTQLNGKSTASGEPYDGSLLTAAHRTLPLGSEVRVTNLSNGRSVRVRVNDRGPHVAGRIIDLSSAAAAALRVHGIARVRLDAISEPDRGGTAGRAAR